MNLGQRIMVMGSSGSGKSTMARTLGERLSLPAVHCDTLLFHPGWVARPNDEVDANIRAAADQPKWVIDGNYSRTQDYRLERADTVILLQMNRWLCLWRAIKRRVKYHGKSRPCMTEGCNERITWWLIKWIVWNYPRKHLRSLAWLAEIPPTKQVFHLKGRRAVKKFLAKLEG